MWPCGPGVGLTRLLPLPCAQTPHQQRPVLSLVIANGKLFSGSYDYTIRVGLVCAQPSSLQVRQLDRPR